MLLINNTFCISELNTSKFREPFSSKGLDLTENDRKEKSRWY